MSFDYNHINCEHCGFTHFEVYVHKTKKRIFLRCNQCLEEQPLIDMEEERDDI